MCWLAAVLLGRILQFFIGVGSNCGVTTRVFPGETFCYTCKDFVGHMFLLSVWVLPRVWLLFPGIYKSILIMGNM